MKKDGEDLFEKFKDSFSKMNGHFHILEQRVPVEAQVAYFKYSEWLRRNKRISYPVSDETCEAWYEELLTVEGVREKRRLLSSLASSRSVRAYRLLEAYAKAPDPAVANWAYMAVMEARIMLESELSEEKQIFISTGLGGRDGKLRFCVLLVARAKEGFQDYQKKTVEREAAYSLPLLGCEIEELYVADRYVKLFLLIPVGADIKGILDRVVNECNQYGDFLSNAYTVTNVKELTDEEIEAMVEKAYEDSGTSN